MAEKQCNQLPGGHLAAFRSQEELDFIKILIGYQFSSSFLHTFRNILKSQEKILEKFCFRGKCEINLEQYITL